MYALHNVKHLFMLESTILISIFFVKKMWYIHIWMLKEGASFLKTWGGPPIGGIVPWYNLVHHTHRTKVRS